MKVSVQEQFPILKKKKEKEKVLQEKRNSN